MTSRPSARGEKPSRAGGRQFQTLDVALVQFGFAFDVEAAEHAVDPPVRHPDRHADVRSHAVEAGGQSLLFTHARDALDQMGQPAVEDALADGVFERCGLAPLYAQCIALGFDVPEHAPAVDELAHEYHLQAQLLPNDDQQVPDGAIDRDLSGMELGFRRDDAETGLAAFAGGSLRCAWKRFHV